VMRCVVGWMANDCSFVCLLVGWVAGGGVVVLLALVALCTLLLVHSRLTTHDVAKQQRKDSVVEYFSGNSKSEFYNKGTKVRNAPASDQRPAKSFDHVQQAVCQRFVSVLICQLICLAVIRACRLAIDNRLAMPPQPVRGCKLICCSLCVGINTSGCKASVHLLDSWLLMTLELHQFVSLVVRF
jgi:hypothetical protein